MIKYTIINSALNNSNMPQESKTVLKTIHNAGFFSNCTIRLMDIVAYVYENGHLPDEVDSWEQFVHYKSYPGQNLIPYYFDENQEKTLKISPKPFKLEYDCMSIQFGDYKNLPFDKVYEIIEKYFTPSISVDLIRNTMREKYKLNHNEYCAVFYRGNDKYREMELSPYQLYIDKAKEVKAKNPKIKFLVQPDEREFLEVFMAEFPDSIYFEETPMLSKMDSAMFFELPQHERAVYGAKFFAAVLLLSECKEVITHSGNGALWLALYRGNAKGIHQIFNNQWY
jgi:hypothetical protein